MMERFTLRCNKCGSEDVSIYAGYDGNYSVSCNDCDNDYDTEEDEEE